MPPPPVAVQAECPPTFRSELVALDWALALELTIATDNAAANGREHGGGDGGGGGGGAAGRQQKTITWRLPLTVHS